MMEREGVISAHQGQEVELVCKVRGGGRGEGGEETIIKYKQSFLVAAFQLLSLLGQRFIDQGQCQAFRSWYIFCAYQK